MKNKPKYPIYIISKGRFENCLTAKFFINDNVDFNIVVESQEAKEYQKRYGKKRVLILPFSNLGKGSMPARNWVWEDSQKKGAKRHWIFDDNISWIARRFKGKKIRCNANIALKVAEDFTDRYTNIGISGFNYEMFLPMNQKYPPFVTNCHVYSALLILNSIPYKWRMKYNEDVDLCLQVIDGGLCTVLFNAYMIKKIRTMTMKGGNSDELYKDNGRLNMARSLEAMWPEYVTVKWRFGRPQHVIKNSWKNFKTPLIRRKNIDWNNFESNEYGMKLIKIQEIKSKELQQFYNETNYL